MVLRGTSTLLSNHVQAFLSFLCYIFYFLCLAAAHFPVSWTLTGRHLPPLLVPHWQLRMHTPVASGLRSDDSRFVTFLCHLSFYGYRRIFPLSSSTLSHSFIREDPRAVTSTSVRWFF